MTSSSKIAELKIPLATGMAYCKETCSVLLCIDNAIEYCHLSSSGFSLQPQKTLKLLKGLSSTSLRIAKRMGAIFIGFEGNEGIYVFDGKSHQLIKKFAQNMKRDFDFMAVDETEDPQCCTVYTISMEEGLLTKLDYNSGSMLSELSVEAPLNITLKDNKLYVICGRKSEEGILVVDKCSLKIQNKFALSNWSKLGGLCLDESGNICVTALDKSDHRFIYSFDDGGNLVREVLLSDSHEYKAVFAMFVVDNDMIMLTADFDTVDCDATQCVLNRINLR